MPKLASSPLQKRSPLKKRSSPMAGPVVTTPKQSPKKSPKKNPLTSPRQKDKITLLEAKLSVLSAEFQAIVDSRETELKHVKENWRRCEESLAEKVATIAALRKTIASLEEENGRLKSSAAELQAEMDKLQKTHKNVALAQFVRGQI